MEIQEEIENYRRYYQETIKQFFEQGEYMLAYFELGNFLILANIKNREFCTKIHMGMSFLASTEILHERLKEGKKLGIETAVKMFEAYSAQTKLPCTYGNRNP